MFAMFEAAVTIAVLSLSQTTGSVQARSAPDPSEIVEIDGGRHPEMIPEYLLWEHGFSGLAIIKAKDIQAAKQSLVLSPRDAELVFKEADAQAERERRRSERERARRAALADAQPAELGAALRDVILEYRRDVLRARDRLLASLSPEGQDELIRWMNDRRPNIKARVPRGELDFFRQPR